MSSEIEETSRSRTGRTGRRDSPGSRAVLEQDVEVFGGEEFASVDSWLNGSQSAQDAHLFNIAHNGHDVQSLGGRDVRPRVRETETDLEFGVDGVQAADQMLEEEFEGLWQAEQELGGLFVGGQEGGDSRSSVLDDATVVRRDVRTLLRRVVGVEAAAVVRVRATGQVVGLRVVAVLVAARGRRAGGVVVLGQGVQTAVLMGRPHPRSQNTIRALRQSVRE